MRVLSPLHAPQTLYSIHIPDILYHLGHPDPPPHPTPIPTRSLSSEAPHTHKSLKYPSQALHIYLKPFTLISGPPHPPKSPSHPTQVLRAHSYPLPPSLAFYTHPWLYTPVQDPPAARGMALNVQYLYMWSQQIDFKYEL